jgi:hypothetical protein
MSNLPDEETINRLHRYFAVENNNRAWALVEQADRSAEETREMLNVAAAAAVHWGAVGNEQQQARADCLLALAHAFCGHGSPAVALIERGRAVLAGPECPDWEQVFLAAISAEAAFAAGDSSTHASQYAEAMSLLQSVADPEDAAIVEATLKRLTRPSDVTN